MKTGEKIGPIRQGLSDADDRATVLFFPVFDQVGNVRQGSFHIIGWAAFVLDRPAASSGGRRRDSCTGHFVTYLATDLAGGGTIAGGNRLRRPRHHAHAIARERKPQ